MFFEAQAQKVSAISPSPLILHILPTLSATQLHTPQTLAEKEAIKRPQIRPCRVRMGEYHWMVKAVSCPVFRRVCSS